MISRVLVASGALLLVYGVAALLDGEVRATDRDLLLRVFGNGFLLVVAGRMLCGAVLRAEARIQEALAEWYGLLYAIAHDLSATFEQLRRADTLSRAVLRRGDDRRVRRSVQLVAGGAYLGGLAVAVMAFIALAAVVTFESIISPVVAVTAGCVAVAFVCFWAQPIDRKRISHALRLRFTHLELDPTKPEAAPAELRPVIDALAASCDRASIPFPTVWVALSRGPKGHFVARAARLEDGDFVIVSDGLVDSPPSPCSDFSRATRWRTLNSATRTAAPAGPMRGLAWPSSDKARS